MTSKTAGLGGYNPPGPVFDKPAEKIVLNKRVEPDAQESRVSSRVETVGIVVSCYIGIPSLPSSVVLILSSN